jgi:hypothetical protein
MYADGIHIILTRRTQSEIFTRFTKNKNTKANTVGIWKIKRHQHIQIVNGKLNLQEF